MSGEIIRLGDRTSHGGVVIEGSATDICMGKPISFIGHKVFCPLCKGAFPIVEGASNATFYGKGVALAGMHTACGAVLIATQFTDRVHNGRGSAPATTRLGQGRNPHHNRHLVDSTCSTIDFYCWTRRPGNRFAIRNMQFAATQENSNMALPTAKDTHIFYRQLPVPR